MLYAYGYLASVALLLALLFSMWWQILSPLYCSADINVSPTLCRYEAGVSSPRPGWITSP